MGKYGDAVEIMWLREAVALDGRVTQVGAENTACSDHGKRYCMGRPWHVVSEKHIICLLSAGKEETLTAKKCNAAAVAQLLPNMLDLTGVAQRITGMSQQRGVLSDAIARPCDTHP
jgi:hypothetical protein